MSIQMRVGVGGFTSDVGKTTLICDLLRCFPGWEAIKTTRGHYRSCGKDPHACCVSDLLADEPIILSGREQTYVSGKDTGRYWEAGAENVHWVIATDQQVKAGIKQALARVTAPGVFIEGNSFTDFIEPDFFIMVARFDGGGIKRSARRALNRASALYLTGTKNTTQISEALRENVSSLPVFTLPDLPRLVAVITRISEKVRSSSVVSCP